MNQFKELLKSMSLLSTLMIFSIFTIYADTYTVTSTDFKGSGSLFEAIEMANANPGPDVIEFTPGLKVDARNYSDDALGIVISDYVLAKITDEVVIDGMGGEVFGSLEWVSVSGGKPFDDCPSRAGHLIVAETPGLFALGNKNQDNSDVKVTIKNLDIRQFNHVVYLQKNSSMIMEDVKVKEIWNMYRCEAAPIIWAKEGASVTLRNSDFYNYHNFEPSLPSFISGILGEDAGDLLIENCRISNFYSQSATRILSVMWDGAPGSEVNIISSVFAETGGIRLQGDLAETNIVNTIWNNKTILVPQEADRHTNISSGDMNIIASTFMWNSDLCDGYCQSLGIISPRFFERLGSGMINFEGSAVGINFVVTDPESVPTLYDAGTGGFSADAYTWMQPTILQDAATLKTITGQPGLLTDPVAFNTPQFTNFVVPLVTPAPAGQLIDVIPDAGPGGANELMHPVTGEAITVDALGNPRTDGSLRTIGAIQLTADPHLSVTGTGNQSVSLHWNKPLATEVTLSGYEIEYSLTGAGSWTSVNVAGENTLDYTVGGLTNGMEYEFRVRAIGTDLTFLPYEGPWSNVVTATPYGMIGTPVLTAYPGDKEVALSWTLPDLGGLTFEAYTILWRIAGETDYTDAMAIYNAGTTTTTISGLKNGTTYEFAVAVNAGGEVGGQGTASATPYKPSDNENCTLTAGYWQTHSEYGPAFYDDTWAMLAEGADTEFFLSGQTYYEVINSSVEGNVYYILAQQYIATELNFKQGADPADVQDAFDAATGYFNTYTPDEVAAWPSSGDMYMQFVDLAMALDDYNNGITGPGHCDGDMKTAPADLNAGDDLSDIFTYYPNPVKDVLYINTDKDYRIEVISPAGQIVMDVRNETAVDVSQLENGLYIVRIEIEGQFFTGKISKH